MDLDETWNEKKIIEQVLAEIKHYLEPTLEMTKSREFLAGLCCGLHVSLDGYPAFVTNKLYLGALVSLALDSAKYKKD